MPFKEKHLRVHPSLTLAGWQLKPYHVLREADRPLPPEVVAAAHRTAESMLPEPDHELPPAGWLVLHEGGNGAMYLCVCTWVWGNVVEVRTAAAAEPFVGCPDDDPTHFVVNRAPYAGCVWELPALAHERTAWVRRMLAPDAPDLAGYLRDTLAEGPTGG
ncbi:hypothetical protein [Streptacidiphilus jiangxiensis]|uniref:Uncharacterized protein n=1 Tax=Streptacidiphilus jiangxiensis TaxID=235985 RepID=A0A1H7YM13_STRJI|nr:hypothetical protein [Streptacidiphilus jiangxiensis]SEM46874.1 hypothetical protein SAMN05414137_12958 [Streptacidiphilus jiangxiensis]